MGKGTFGHAAPCDTIGVKRPLQANISIMSHEFNKKMKRL
jgi:hypothetical protein